MRGFQNKIIMRKLIKINGKISKLQSTIGNGGNLKNTKCKEYIPCVYVIECSKWKLEDGTKYYKIGRTNNPRNRLKQLRKHFNTEKLKYKLLFETKKESIIENKIHIELQKFNIKHPLSTELYNVSFNNIKIYFINYEENCMGTILSNICIYSQ